MTEAPAHGPAADAWLPRSPAFAALAVAILLGANAWYATSMPALVGELRPEHPLLYFDSESPIGRTPVRFAEVLGTGIEYARPAWGDLPPYATLITGGLAVGDVDGDGWNDVYFAAGGPDTPARLYLNRGDWTFADATQAWGLEATGYGAGAAFADHDNDGDADLFALLDDSARMYRNDGGRFADVTGQSGITLSGLCGAPCQPSSFTWTDVEGDGDLDIFGVNNLDWRDPDLRASGNMYSSIVAFGRGQRTFLFENQGDGTFRDATLDRGAWDVEKGLGAIAADMDGDRRPELMTANDLRPNAYFQNEGDGTFANVATLRGARQADKSSMGMVATDLTGDGRPDLAITNLRYERMSLLVQQPDGSFAEEAQQRGLGATADVTGWGLAAFDADLDGWPDLAYAAGRAAPVQSHLDDLGHRVVANLKEDTRDLLFRNDGTGHFLDVTQDAGLGDDAVTRGIVAADLDNDGDLDLVRLHLDGRPAQLLRNDLPGPATSVTIDLEGSRSNRDGVGARVEVTTPDGRTQIGEMTAAAGYQSGVPTTLTFGLGGAPGAGVRIHWPSGAVQDAGHLPAGRHLVAEPA